MLQRKDRSLSQEIGRADLFSRKGKVQLPTLPQTFLFCVGLLLSAANANYGRSLLFMCIKLVLQPADEICQKTLSV